MEKINDWKKALRETLGLTVFVIFIMLLLNWFKGREETMLEYASYSLFFFVPVFLFKLFYKPKK